MFPLLCYVWIIRWFPENVCCVIYAAGLANRSGSFRIMRFTSVSYGSRGPEAGAQASKGVGKVRRYFKKREKQMQMTERRMAWVTFM